MMLRDQLAAVPRWRVGLYAFIAGAALTLVLALVAAANGLVTPPVEREVEVHTVFRERAVTKVAKRANVSTTVVSTPGLLRVPDGGVLLVHTVTTTTRDLSTEDSATASSSSTDTSSRTRETPVLPSWTVGALGGVLLTPGAAPRGVVGLEAGYRVPLDRLGLPPRYSGWVEAWGLVTPPVAGQPVVGALGLGVRGEF